MKGRGLRLRIGPPAGRKPKSAPKTEQERSHQRDAQVSWRSWYKSARWQKLRLKILKRDGWRCQVTGVRLVGKYPAANSPVADHKIPHLGDERLFWDESNIHAVSKDYHDSQMQREERMHRS